MATAHGRRPQGHLARARPARVDRSLGPVSGQEGTPLLRSRQALVTRQRFAFAGALVVAGSLPFMFRLLILPDPDFVETSKVSLVATSPRW